MTRAFVAVCLDDPVREAVAAEIERLRPLSHAVAWVPADNLHFTLKFLGEQGDASLTEAVAGLREAAAGCEPFPVGLRGLGAFPGMDRPRILWIGVTEGAVELRALQSRVEAALERRGFAREVRPWHPHLTVGRVFDPRRWKRDTNPALQGAVARAASTAYGRLTVARIVLMRSDLSRAGSRYSELVSVGLEAA